MDRYIDSAKRSNPIVLALLLLQLICFLSSKAQDSRYLPEIQGRRLDYTNFIIDFDEELGLANSVSYELEGAEIDNPTVSRTDNFRADDRVIMRIRLENYVGSGFDRGHLAPAGDQVESSVAMSESFLLTNIAPQTPNLNRGKWKQLEESCRSWASEYESIYISTGPVLKMGYYYKGGIPIPKYYYKAVLRTKPDYSCIGFILPNGDVSKNLGEYSMSIDDLEQSIGIDLFCALEDSIEAIIESRMSYDWIFVSGTVKRSSTSTGAMSKQCKGIAKSTGNRCRNKTTNLNEYCHLHQSQDNSQEKTIIHSNQCTAITKLGTRCSRKAEVGRSRCWQH